MLNPIPSLTSLVACGSLKDPGALCGNLYLPEVVGHPKLLHTALTLPSSGGFVKGARSVVSM